MQNDGYTFDNGVFHNKSSNDPSREEPSYGSSFTAGWELANWKLGSPCPNSNITLAEFSASLQIKWPPQESDASQYIEQVQESLLRCDPHIIRWLEIGLLSNSVLLETRGYKGQEPRSESKLKRLMELQSELAEHLVKANLFPEERQEVVAAVQDILNKDEEVAVPRLIEAYNMVFARLEEDELDDLVFEEENEQMEEYLKGEVDFVIITVREDEHKAILKRFPSHGIYDGLNRSYSICQVLLEDDSFYLVAVVRSIEQGEGHGQDVARDAIEDLDPQWIILVGIAGGVPAPEFTLGDVVIAFRLTDFSVRAVLEGKNTQYVVSGGPMHKHVQNRIALIPAMSEELGGWNNQDSIGMAKPPVSLDTSNFYGSEEWQHKVRESLSRHFGSNVEARPPLVTTGSVISGDTLVKDSRTLQQWQESARQVAAVEMELGGIYIAARRANHEYPILAIRGLSDIVGFKRHPDWTEYACNSAAAFAHAFILTNPIRARALNNEK